jgi:hypothetical protein
VRYKSLVGVGVMASSGLGNAVFPTMRRSALPGLKAFDGEVGFARGSDSVILAVAARFGFPAGSGNCCCRVSSSTGIMGGTTVSISLALDPTNIEPLASARAVLSDGLITSRHPCWLRGRSSCLG